MDDLGVHFDCWVGLDGRSCCLDGGTRYSAEFELGFRQGGSQRITPRNDFAHSESKKSQIAGLLYQNLIKICPPRFIGDFPMICSDNAPVFK